MITQYDILNYIELKDLNYNFILLGTPFTSLSGRITRNALRDFKSKFRFLSEETVSSCKRSFATLTKLKE